MPAPNSAVAVVVLDRPNPNGHHDRRAGARHEVQVGRRSLADSRAARAYDGRNRPDGRRRRVEPETAGLDVVLLPQLHPCDTLYRLARSRPSPNLPTQRAVYLYPSLCLFEGTVVSLGRGTDKPFEIYGHPDMTGLLDSRLRHGRRQGPSIRRWRDRLCHGADLSRMPLDEARAGGTDAALRDRGLSQSGT